jgi:hypothetical protein
VTSILGPVLTAVFAPRLAKVPEIAERRLTA